MKATTVPAVDQFAAARRFAEGLFVASRTTKTTFSSCPRLKPLESLVPSAVFEFMLAAKMIDADGWLPGRDVAGDERTPRVFADASIDPNHQAVSPIVFHIICALIAIADQLAAKRGWKTT